MTSQRRAIAESCTLYKPGDIENALRNVSRHGWAQRIVDGWKGGAAFALRQDRAFFDALIPELTPGSFYGQNCPACVGRQSVMGESGIFDWGVETPDRLTCNRCGTVYPNEHFPETGTLECPRMGQTFTYYETDLERADPANRNRHALKWLGDRPTMTSFSGTIRFARVRWAFGQAPLLAKLYALTGDVACAERAAWILDRFARVYPNYIYHSYDGTVADLPPAEVAANMGRQEGAGGPNGGRFPREAIRHAYGLHQSEDHATLNNGFWGAGRLNVHGKGSDAGPLLDLTVAYDLIRDATYADGRRVLDDGMERRIVEDLIEAGCADVEHWDSVSNKGVAVFSLVAAVGALLKQPGRVRHALAGFNRTMESRYHFDGFYSESPAYAAHNFENVHEVADILHGYSDPPGFQPEQGPRMEDLNLFTSGRFHPAMQSMLRMLAPGRRLPVIGDTVYDTGVSLLYAEILAARLGGQYAGLLEAIQGAGLSERGTEYALWYRPFDLRAGGPVELPLRSEWFPGWHVGVLRGGEAGRTAVYLNGNENRWTVHTGHRHRDILSLSAYAFGEELVSDRGYFSGSGQLTREGLPGQRWLVSTLSHNLVVVDSENQSDRDCGSNLELFGIAPGIEVAQASGVKAYPQCETYRRTVALARTPDGQVYAVDFFRVKGGQTHHYSFVCEGSLTPGQMKTEPVDLPPAWGGWLSHAKAFLPGAPYTFTWRSGRVGLDLTLLNIGDTVKRVIVADAPGWRRGSPASELERPPLGQILVENRAGDAGGEASTQYAAILAPYRSERSPVLGARLLVNDLRSGVVAVEVRLAGRTDYFISTPDQEERQYGPVNAAGEFAFLSVDDAGRATQGYLLNGTRLACGDVRIALPEPHTTLRVRSAEGNTFYLADPLPPGQAVSGSYLLAGASPRTGFEVESAEEGSITVRDYPAIACEDITLLNSRWMGEKV